MNPAPYLTTPDAVPFDLVEFTYLPGASSTFDLTAVNGFVVPMTLTTTDPQGQGASLSVGTRPTGISRADIGTAFRTFMENDPQGGSFTQLRYDAAAAPFAAPPGTPAEQFFAIVNPWYWITNQNNQQTATPAGLNAYWDATLDTFFQVGNTLSIDLGPGRIYGGTSSVIGGVNTYTFTNPAGRTVLTLPQPSPGYQSASFVFGNSLSYAPNTFPGGAFPAGDPGLIIVNVMAALNRGVALDGVITTPPASVAVEAAPTGASMSVVGGITVTMDTGSPHGLVPGDTVLVQGVTIAPPGGPTAAFPDGYNGSFTVLATPSATRFTYQPTPAAGTDPVTGRLQPGGGGTVTRAGQSTAAWNAFANWYGAPSNPTHPVQPYNTYAKFLHHATIDGTDSRLGGTPIFINDQAYGFSLDENPNGPYTGTEVPSKFDGTITDGSLLTLTLNPWTSSPSAPTVVSVATRPPQVRPGMPTPTAPGTVTWDVLFDEPVTGVTAANFALVPSAGLTGSGDIQVSPASTVTAVAWTVTASTGTGSGTLGLNLANNIGAITDSSGQSLAAGFTGQVYAIREAPPVGPTASITIPTDAPNPTSAATVTFDVTFSEPVSGLSNANFTPVAAGISGAAVQGVSGRGDTWTVTVGTGSGSGTLGLQLASGTGINPAPTGLPVTSAPYTIRQTPVAPALQSISRDLPSPTDQPLVSWTVRFSEAVAGVSAGNFSLASSGLSGARISQVVRAPGTGTGWTVTALTGGGTGTLRLDMVNATGITDAEGLAPIGIPLPGQTYDVTRGDVPGVRLPIAFWAQPGRRTNLVWPRSLVPLTGPATRELTVTLAATGGDGSFTARQGVRGVTVAGTGTGSEISLTGTARRLNTYLRTAGRLGYTPSGESLLPRVLSVSAVTTTDTLAGMDTAAILVRGHASPGRPTIVPQTALGPTPPGTPLEITYDMLLAAADVPAAATRSVEFLLGRIATGRLELWDGAEWVRVKPRLPRFARSFEEPLLAPGGRIRWTPPAGRRGTVPAFTVRAWDGRLKSADVSQVSIDVGTG